MQTTEAKTYDCAIIGGGLAGLCLSIQLCKKGISVIVIEKNNYPFHKVCGEYISMDSWNFLESLGVRLSQMNLPKIDSIHITAHNGYKISSPLELGGFGISRYTLDNELAKIAKALGVIIIENCKVTNVELVNTIYSVKTTQASIIAKLVCGSYGKISPSFIDKPIHKIKANYIGVKYHIKTIFPDNLIELHNFKDGYCGISKVDNDTYCLCYLTTAKNLQANHNDIKTLEKNVLMQNPFLKKYFTESTFLFEKPLAVSQISFNKKQTYQNNILLLGDSAGAIAPLCGNGMSIGMRSSKILANLIEPYLKEQISKAELIKLYAKEWDANFSFRIKTGYYLQQLFGNEISTVLILKIVKRFPSIFKKLISLTHGQTF